MATVMSWGNSEGEKGRCDAKCHGAEEPVCRCMCGGRFHGATLQPGGLDQAIERYWDEVVENARRRAELEEVELDILAPQLSLF